MPERAEQRQADPAVEAPDDAEWQREMEPFAERMRMALSEAGYPDAHVYIGPTGVFVEGVPDDVQHQAATVCGG